MHQNYRAAIVCPDAACRYTSGRDCNRDGTIDNDYRLCPYLSTSGYDCFGDTCADPQCVYIDGRDCGTNGGAPSNQTPDGRIDGDISFCAHVTAGYDCDSGCNANHPAWTTGGSNAGIDGGACLSPTVLADPECRISAHRCSRLDEPGRCGSESRAISLTVSILNGEGRTPPNSNDYQCILSDQEFEIRAFDYTAEGRFLTEGCQEVLNAIYFDDGGQYKYIRYEDWIDMAAKATCQWRNPHTMLSCDAEPFKDVDAAYIQVENLSNPEMEIE